jgi:hypothetical protein
MLSDFNTRFQMINDCEQFAIDMLERYAHANNVGEAEYHCQGYAGEGKPYTEHVIGCKVTQNGKIRRHTFTLNGKRIARHKIALRLGELGV